MRTFLAFILIIVIAYFTFKVYLPVKPEDVLINRKDISSELLNPSQNKQPPHYKFINQGVYWKGELVSYKVSEGNKVQLRLWVDQTVNKSFDTILVTRIENIREYFNQNKGKVIWIKGKIVKIELQKTGKELVYVNGIVEDNL